MPIERGESWGSEGQLSASAPVVSTDAAAASYVGQEPMLAVDHGDLARTLGVRHPFDRSAATHLLPVDAIRVELDDGSSHLALAHVVLGSVRWSSESVAVMNAAFLDGRNIAPRAHPGDGKADVIHLSLSLGDRMKAWNRMATGTHIPHPDIVVSRRSQGELVFERRLVVRVDGVALGRTRSLRYRIEPDAVIVAV